MEYFLLIEGQQQGPFTNFEILSRIRDGRLKGDELVWRKGAESWQPLRSLEDFASDWPPTPEIIAAAEQARSIARTALDAPQPWLRFWARMLDYFLYLMVLNLVLAFFFPDPKSLLAFGQELGAAVNSLLLLFYVPVEAWLLSRWGTTPGKSMLRIQVRRRDGKLPVFSQALARSILVYIKGIGLGLNPFISIFTMSWARWRLVRRQIASWDEQTGLRVEHGEPEAWRYGVLFLVALIFVILMVAVFQTPEVQELMRSLPKH